ncbi:MAG: hypothetical protein IPH10_12280 [bacterium]|nr:hypothetical protein [bacterium]
MSALRFASILGILLCSSVLFAFEQMPDDPANTMAPKHVKMLQLCSPTADAGAGCNPADRVSKSASYAMRNGVNATVATVRFGVSELSQTPRMVRESISATGATIRGASEVSVQTTDSLFTVLYTLTTTFLRIVFSSISALASAIWPF